MSEAFTRYTAGLVHPGIADVILPYPTSRCYVNTHLSPVVLSTCHLSTHCHVAGLPESTPPTSRLMSQHGAFPPHLVNLVIDELGNSYQSRSSLAHPLESASTYKALCKCALVSKKWTVRSQAHLFESVKIDVRKGQPTLPPPGPVLPYIKHLDIWYGHRPTPSASTADLLKLFSAAPIERLAITGGVLVDKRVCIQEFIGARSATLQTINLNYCSLSATTLPISSWDATPSSISTFSTANVKSSHLQETLSSTHRTLTRVRRRQNWNSAFLEATPRRVPRMLSPWSLSFRIDLADYMCRSRRCGRWNDRGDERADQGERRYSLVTSSLYLRWCVQVLQVERMMSLTAVQPRRGHGG